MMPYRKNIVSERQERWRREDAAPRLVRMAPTLETLRLMLKEFREDSPAPGSERTQHVVVARAGARFEFPCGEPKCQAGGYDVTSDVLDSLGKQREHFEGSMSCCGMVGDNPCRRSLRFTGVATYVGPRPLTQVF